MGTGLAIDVGMTTRRAKMEKRRCDTCGRLKKVTSLTHHHFADDTDMDYNARTPRIGRETRWTRRSSVTSSQSNRRGSASRR